ncbi:MAG: proton-conducting transporter membrane subunit, partial [Rubrivivax sp.]
MRRGLILFAHGARSAAWSRPLEALEREFAAAVPDRTLRSAFLELQQPAQPTGIDELAAMAARQELGEEARVAMCFVAVAALLKCAQMPFHGWLLRVMEAPTPVSALLHAGVVNLGGFVLLRLAPLLAE